MPAGATPIDFAYRIHTDLGHRCVGAQGERPARAAELPAAERRRRRDHLAEERRAGPSRDWLNANLGYIKTGHSREKIRQWFKKQERAENIERGREIDREGAAPAQPLAVRARRRDPASIFKYDTLDDFLAAVGYGGVSTAHMATRLAPLIHKDDEPDAADVDGPVAARRRATACRCSAPATC